MDSTNLATAYWQRLLPATGASPVSQPSRTSRLVALPGHSAIFPGHLAKLLERPAKFPDHLGAALEHLAKLPDCLAKPTGHLAIYTDGLAKFPNHLAKSTDYLAKCTGDPEPRPNHPDLPPKHPYNSLNNK
jgi:hypothetical protein